MNALPPNAFSTDTVQPLEEVALLPTSGKPAFYAWRGYCVATIARAEMAVTRALLTLMPPEKKLGDYQLIGLRFDAVEEALIVKGAEAKDALRALKAYRPWLQLRAYLCHGEATVTTSADHWQASFRLISLNGDKLRHDRATISSNQAEEERRNLQSATDSLMSRLKPWRGADDLFDRLNMSGAFRR